MMSNISLADAKENRNIHRNIHRNDWINRLILKENTHACWGSLPTRRDEEMWMRKGSKRNGQWFGYLSRARVYRMPNTHRRRFVRAMRATADWIEIKCNFSWQSAILYIGRCVCPISNVPFYNRYFDIGSGIYFALTQKKVNVTRTNFFFVISWIKSNVRRWITIGWGEQASQKKSSSSLATTTGCCCYCCRWMDRARQFIHTFPVDRKAQRVTLLRQNGIVK